jgi:hypothetical protein
MRQYVADASLAHRMHRDTICQAIALVGPCFVKYETRHECFMALWRQFDIRAAENSFSLGDCSTASLFAVLRKEIQEFLRGKTKRPPALSPATFVQSWLPTLDTLRNFFLAPTTEVLTLFQVVREVVLWN